MVYFCVTLLLARTAWIASSRGHVRLLVSRLDTLHIIAPGFESCILITDAALVFLQCTFSVPGTVLLQCALAKKYGIILATIASCKSGFHEHFTNMKTCMVRLVNHHCCSTPRSPVCTRTVSCTKDTGYCNAGRNINQRN